MRGGAFLRRPILLETRMPTILAVDDEPALLLAYETALTLEGYRVRTAATPAHALEAFAAERPDLILLDIQLGTEAMDGLDLLREFRVRRPEVPVIIASAYLSEARHTTAQVAGAAAVLRKPVTLDCLRQCVGKVLVHSGQAAIPGRVV